MLQQELRQEQAGASGGGASGDSSDDGPSTGGIPSLFGSKKRKIKLIIGIIVAIIIIVIIILLGVKETIEDEGKFQEGNMANVPYVISSTIMDSLIIVNDSTGNYTYAFQNESGEVVDLDEALDDALKTLKENDSTATSYLGDSNKEKKALLKKMIQAEIATQYPDLTLNEDLGLQNTSNQGATGSGTDYCVDMNNPNSLPACSEQQLKQIVENSEMSQEAKNNMLSAIPSIVKYQDQYKVNAVFFMAAIRCESGWGTGWDLIDPSTYNWASIKGTENGGYIDRNGESWNRYSSFGEASEGFFRLISREDGYYFGSSKYTVQTIAPTYCNANWGTTVAGYIEQFYSSIGITPNAANAPTASGGEVTTGTKSNATSSNTNSPSQSPGFLNVAGERKKYVADNGYTYGHSDPRNTKLINCASYVSWALKDYGYDAEVNGALINYVPTLSDWCTEQGFEQVYSGQTLSVEEAGLMPGDIVIEGPGQTHTQIYAGKNASGQDIWYNTGGDSSIATQPGEDNFSNPYGSDHYIIEVFRVPGGGSPTGTSSTSSSTGDRKINDEIDQDKTVQGGIQIQRKDEEGNVKALKYTSTKNFNALVSMNDPRALEYYTLVKTSGSANKNSSETFSANMQTDGTKEGNAAAIYSFFVSKGVTKEGAAGILGNMEHESGFMPNNLEDTRESRWGYTDESFTEAVDNGTISRAQFLNNNGEYGYGLVQWTSSGIKGELYDFAKSQGTSIADLAMQCECLYQQLSTDSYYAKLWSVLTTTNSVQEAADTFLEEYERPAVYNYSDRRSGAEKWYNEFSNGVNTQTITSPTNNSSSNSNSSVTNSGGSFVDVATKCHAYLRENGYTYYSGGREMPVKAGDVGTIDCVAYISMVLEEFGLTNWSGYPHQLTSSSIIDYGKSSLETIYQGSAMDVSQLSGIQPGDIIVMSNHAQIFYGFNSSGTAVWLNCGGNDSIQRQEGTDAYNGFWAPVLYVFRVPGEGASESVVTSLDNFLFIGDSRYEGIESQLEALGDNITAKGVVSSIPKNWILPIKNGGGIVYRGNTTSDSRDIGTLPTTVSGVSVMLGVNGVTSTNQVSDMIELLNTIHEKYPNAPVMVNSVYHLGTAYGSGTDSMNAAVDSFNQAMKDFCNQNSWAYYVDVNQNLDDSSGYLKSEYSGDGLHISSAEGITTLVDNIRNGILNSGAVSANNETTESGTGRPGYAIVVANRKDVNTVVVNTYEYSHTNVVEKSNGHTTSGSKTTETPGAETVKSTSTTTYSSVNADYQAALQNFTLYFDFLWAVLVDSDNSKMISKWAELVCDNIGDNSKVMITVYNDTNTSTNTSSQSKGTVTRTNYDADSPVASVDIYNKTETTTVTTVTLSSKACVTSADTWLETYENNADSYSEFKTRSKETIEEKTDPDAKEQNVIKILRSNPGDLETLTKEQYLVENMIEENEKVSFMIDIYDYILKIANGKKKEKIKFKLGSLLDTSLFDLSQTEDTTTTKVLLYDSITISDADRECLYRAVEKICEQYGDNDENTNRKKYVTSVILNRVLSSQFPNSVSEVLKQKYQFENFEPANLGQNITPSDSTKQAVDNIIIAGDCSQYSVYFAKPSTAKKNKWDSKYKFTFNDGDKSDNSYNYYTTEDIEKELKRYVTTISGSVTKPSITAQKIIAWANSQVGKSEFNNKHENKTMSSNNSSSEFIKSAYYEGELEYLSGDIPCPNEIKYRDDGTVDWSDIPQGAVIISNNGIASLYIGNGYIIEAGGSTIQKVSIDQSQGSGQFKGWGFAISDQDEAREKLIVSVGAGGNYAEGWTSFGAKNAQIRSTGIAGIYKIGNRQHNVYVQGYNDIWGSKPYSHQDYANSACGATSVAIIASGYGQNVNPYDAGSVIYSSLGLSNGSYTNAVTSHEGLSNALTHYGLKNSWSYSASKNDILEHLKAGNPVIINISSGSGTRIGKNSYTGHYITLLGMNSQGQIFLGDPAGGGNNNGYYNQEDIFCATYSGVCFISK